MRAAARSRLTTALKASVIVFLTLIATDMAIYACLPRFSKLPSAHLDMVGLRAEMRQSLRRLPGPGWIPPRRGDEFVIGIFGGSVAEELSNEMVFRQGTEPFPGATAIEKRLGRTVRILNLAVSGGREPVQFNRLHLLHDAIDIAVFVDGFNEMSEALPDHKPACEYMAPFWRNNDKIPDELLQPLADLRRTAEELVDSWIWTPLRYSGLFKLYILRLSVRMQERMVGLETSMGTSPVWMYPGTIEERALSWAGCVALADEFAKSMKLPILFFLQPNQYVAGSKPFSEEERNRCVLSTEELKRRGWNRYLELNDAYAAFERQIPSLRAKGIAVYSLTGVFHDVTETVYKDNCCHMHRPGYDIIGERILEVVLEGVASRSAGGPSTH